MDNNTFNNRRFVGRLIYAVLTEQKSVREAISLFPDTKDKDIECAYHALVHYAADEDIRYKDFEYREEQDDYLEFIAQTLVNGKNLPKNIVADYEEYYHGISHKWQDGFKGFLKELLRFINLIPINGGKNSATSPPYLFNFLKNLLGVPKHPTES